MAIEKLGPTASILAAMRAEMSRRTERAGGRDPQRVQTPEAQPPRRGDVNVLRRQLIDLVRPVALDDPEEVRRLRPQFVRTILLWEFGPELREHAEWQPMLETITRALEQHDPDQTQFLKLLTDLKR